MEPIPDQVEFTPPSQMRAMVKNLEDQVRMLTRRLERMEYELVRFGHTPSYDQRNYPDQANWSLHQQMYQGYTSSGLQGAVNAVGSAGGIISSAGLAAQAQPMTTTEQIKKVKEYAKKPGLF